MTATHLLLLIAVFFVSSGIGVVTGSTSVITVPFMFQFGIDVRVAIATNMLALTFMSVGGTLPFLRTNIVNRKPFPLLITLTLVGSAAGAVLLLIISPKAMPVIVSSSIIGLALFSMFYNHSDADLSAGAPSRERELAGYALTFLTGIYGGLFSGGYVTILTVVFVATFGMTFIEAVATTKLINVFSSGIAAVIFMWGGMVDYRLGVILAAVMFIGALLGARFARRLGNLWVRRIYLTAVWALGLKLLLNSFNRGPDLRGSRSPP
jgi:uncharacterized membrane protein YfcA